MKIQFLGGARTVTGSMHLLETNGKRILLECGIFQGPREESENRNRNLPFEAKKIDCLILSHAHLDHSGNIPTLVKQGFKKNIYMTSATKDLLAVMLPDSAHIQKKDTEFVNKKRAEKGLPSKTPLYTLKEVGDCLCYFVGMNYEKPFYITDEIKVTFHDAGHILGSALISLEIKENGKKKQIIFSGDLGRKNLPILRDPYQIQKADILILESTYGNRLHGPIEKTVEELEEVVRRTYLRGGKIIIPAFSVGRTQEIVYELHKLFETNRLPPLPIFVDSPLSVNVTEIFKSHPECYDEETKEMVFNTGDPFGFNRLTYITEVEDSKRLNALEESCIIISASGMCEAGRILHHLRHSIENSRNTILIVGFQAQGTLGKQLVDKAKKVRIFGEEFTVEAEVKVMNGFSAHADRNELLEYLIPVKDNFGPVFLVHGDEDQSLALAEEIKDLGVKEVVVPEVGQIFS
ncbi:MAG: MBL fold metallo-hydrolase [Candidatus Edwardsbacteria bacterium]